MIINFMELFRIIYHFLLSDSKNTNVIKIVISPSAERTVLLSLLTGERDLEYRELNGRSNRHLINLICS
jgi:hypothetical protein